VTVTIGVLLPLPLAFRAGAANRRSSGHHRQRLADRLCRGTPPLPIWMALFYRRKPRAREGADLDAALRGGGASTLANRGLRVEDSG